MSNVNDLLRPLLSLIDLDRWQCEYCGGHNHPLTDRCPGCQASPPKPEREERRDNSYTDYDSDYFYSPSDHYSDYFYDPYQAVRTPPRHYSNWYEDMKGE